MLCGMKVLLWIAVFFFVFWLMRKLRKSGEKPHVPVERPAESMVSCDYCGVNLPLGESILARGKYYCSSAHLQAREFGDVCEESSASKDRKGE